MTSDNACGLNLIHFFRLFERSLLVTSSITKNEAYFRIAVFSLLLSSTSMYSAATNLTSPEQLPQINLTAQINQSGARARLPLVISSRTAARQSRRSSFPPGICFAGPHGAQIGWLEGMLIFLQFGELVTPQLRQHDPRLTAAHALHFIGRQCICPKAAKALATGKGHIRDCRRAAARMQIDIVLLRQKQPRLDDVPSPFRP